jgi:hypothetical protein
MKLLAVQIALVDVVGVIRGKGLCLQASAFLVGLSFKVIVSLAG